MAPRSSRRGVLLIVVLSMLVLFMLIGTAFLMTSSQSRDAAKHSAKFDRLGNRGDQLLKRALMYALRDTENSASATYTHSLLRDLYGTDGFQGVIYSPTNTDFDDEFPTPLSQATRYAGASATVGELGQTQGQFIDIYVVAAGYTPTTSLDLRHVVKLDRNVAGLPQAHTLPLTKGYYNGCLLTITTGPAAGQSARIVDYEVAELVAAGTNPPTTATRLIRFRVMAFGRTDGGSLQIGTNDTPPKRVPELTDLAGETFLVNGRPFNGTGVGFNTLAQIGQPRLNALEQFVLDYDVPEYVAGEISLLPNARYFSAVSGSQTQYYLPPTDVFPASSKIFAPFSASHSFLVSPYVRPLNNNSPLNLINYSNFVGPGDADEGYDAADYQNMWLALMTVTPREQGLVVHKDSSGNETYFDANDAACFARSADFARLDLENIPLPSFHRPDLVNFWYHRLHRLLMTPPEAMPKLGGLGFPDPDEAVRAIFQPHDPVNGQPYPGLTAQQAAMIAAIKRRIMMRPLRQDHPNFDGSNTQSLPADLTGSDLAIPIPPIPSPPEIPDYQIAIPYWEAVGPWDVDNDNDGVRDSVWVDLGDPVLELEDGTRVKALYSYLIVDLDSRLNVNAHGLADHINPANLALEQDPATGNFFHVDNLAGTNPAGTPATFYNTNLLAPGLGYGPAEINLRPVFPIPWNADGTPNFTANRSEASLPIDSYATLLAGRTKLDNSAVTGKYGYRGIVTGQQKVTPGYNYDFLASGWQDPSSPTGDTAQPDLAAQLKFFAYPWVISQLSAFGTPPDLMGRYAVGIDYLGQPVYEVVNDLNPATLPLVQAQWRDNHLLANSPYELNLSDAQRRDTSSASFDDADLAFTNSLSQNDDAPYSAADMERVLRAWDADSGTLPSRLWDVVDVFDPLKLMRYDPYRVQSIANDVFDPTARSIQQDDPEFLTAAQQIAAINRRLVTADSFDLPIPGGTLPNLGVLALGPDGMPGRFNVDEDNDGIADWRDANNNTQLDHNEYDLAELNAPISDDFRPLFGKEVSQATIFDLLRYRVWTQVRREVMQSTSPPLTEVTLADLDVAEYTDFLKTVSLLAEVRLNGETTTDVNGNGVQDPPMAQLLAPELVAGKRMDLERPFGDGQDNAGNRIDDDGNGLVDEPNEPGDPFNAGNGVVDDPLEVGDPFLDVNGNGKWDPSLPPGFPNGEPYIDLDANGDYSPPQDYLWAELTAVGTIGEAIAFDYTNGQGENIHREALAGVPLATVRNLDSQGRQHYARHLYCLMLLLVDEKYVAPWDENDPQLMTWIEGERAKLTGATPPVSAEEADFIVKRKATCRAIAQWAINCVDMRDSDVIMTPFEYDENPWDGWGVPQRNATTKQIIGFVPLDGDPSTDENNGDVIDWKATYDADGAKVVSRPTPTVPGLVNPQPLPQDQTRGLVWGAERPELLITETLAVHDRRTEDHYSPDGHNDFSSSGGKIEDYDMDQSLRPRGSLFIEILNTTASVGQYPAELYRHRDGTAHTVAGQEFEGVLLNRLSNFAADVGDPNVPHDDKLSTALSSPTIKRSPVWRVIVVEEDPVHRNRDYLTRDDYLQAHKDINYLGPNMSAPYAAAATARYDAAGEAVKAWRPMPATMLPPFRPTNPDFTEAFDIGFKPSQNGTDNVFDIRYPYVEREFYFTSDNSPRDVTNAAFRLRIPQRFIDVNIDGTIKRQQTQRFIAPTAPSGTEDQPIAPILPGRYGVIGSAGTKYTTVDPIKDRFTTTIGRVPPLDPSAPNTADDDHIPNQTRRIELKPDTNPDATIFESNPNINQLLVAANGGFFDPTKLPLLADSRFTREIGRDNELIDVDPDPDVVKVQNIYDSIGNPDAPDGTTDSEYYHPCVAIPVDGMNVSEPPWGWEPREEAAAREEFTRRQNAPATPGVPAPSAPVRYEFDPNAAKGEGRYMSAEGNPQYYDVPFDIAPELVRTGTTANHRSIHLQRLANPLAPWNPPPGQFKDAAGVDMHQPGLPVNPYLTVDTSSVDLTAFNGASRAEGNYPDSEGLGEAGDVVQKKKGQLRPWVETAAFKDRMKEDRLQIWQFKSLERGAYSLLGATHLINDYEAIPNPNPTSNPETPPNPSTPSPIPQLPQRALYAQEPVVGSVDDLNQPHATGYKAIRDGRITTMMGVVTQILPGEEGVAEDERNRVPLAIKTAQKIQDNHVNMVLEHSLGFGNESAGALYNQPFGAITADDAPTLSAVGAPRPNNPISNESNGAVPPTIVNSTYPWLAWGNRPFVSAKELLDVPAASSAQLLRQFATINSNLTPAAQQNPYDGTGFDAPNAPVTNAARWASFVSPFGHLLNVFLTSDQPATYILPPPPSTDPPTYVGAPHFYRILDYVQVPSRYVGTDTMLTAEIFNDPIGDDITSNQDPRYNFQPPFNRVARERDPGRVNLNTVTGRRAVVNGVPRHWSEVFDGIMHRYRDGNLFDASGDLVQYSHMGPAWRDVVLSRRGYAQSDATSMSVDKPGIYPDTFQFGLNNSFPTMFANPFRSPNAGDLVPLPQMRKHYGVDASWLRLHPWRRNNNVDDDGNGIIDDEADDRRWGAANVDDDGNDLVDDMREAGFQYDQVSQGANAIPATGFGDPADPKLRDTVPLFSETTTAPFIDGDRNASMNHQPMSRLGNLVTNRSNVFAIWITVGYFEVEPAPNWNDPDPDLKTKVRTRFGATMIDADPETIAGLAEYNRVYPDGYMLGREVGSETGDVKRARGFYIVDRTEEIGFKPGEDLNVDKMIRLRRRIE